MKTLTETLIGILERERNGGIVPVQVPEAPQVDPLTEGELYPIGTVFVRKGSYGVSDRAAMLVRSKMNECVLICMPSGNRWSDDHIFKIQTEQPGPTKVEFHIEFGNEWEVTRRGKEALEEWARTDV